VDIPVLAIEAAAHFVDDVVVDYPNIRTRNGVVADVVLRETEPGEG